MDALIYTAMSGAQRAQHSQQVVAHNLANTTTAGFRASLAVAQANAMPGTGLASRHYAVQAPAGLDTTPGVLEPTGRSLDVAIDGDGYLVLAARPEDGVDAVYSRGGSLTLDGNGTLLLHGRPVLGEGGPIAVPPHRDLDIGADGTVAVVLEGSTEPVPVGRLQRVLAMPGDMRSIGGGVLVSDAATLPGDDVAVRGAHLEASNVSAVGAMVQSMNASRDFEMQMRVLKIADDMAEGGNRLVRG
ncbi:flagellar basal body rod protein FlgF [Pandoraea bronchicola]|uniref:Flagellar basal-body rod protein FlgF n=1 Tax=Pandoraea bronchicola TaxID=2508287 RepID=A0A5E5BV69_9BURK|nr:flagellar basal body rod protein FlgF [Pandoraea bronchicola]VVE88273.1 flagellar basal-body rod protein FlgF [Pandoraea bronchicola]